MCLRPLWAPERHAPVIKDGTGRKGRRWLQALPPLPWQLRQFVQPSAEVHQSLAATWGSPQGLTGKPLLHDKDKPSANLGHPHHPFPKKQVSKVGQGHWEHSQQLGSLPAATCHVQRQPAAPQAPHRGLRATEGEAPLGRAFGNHSVPLPLPVLPAPSFISSLLSPPLCLLGGPCQKGGAPAPALGISPGSRALVAGVTTAHTQASQVCSF